MKYKVVLTYIVEDYGEPRKIIENLELGQEPNIIKINRIIVKN